MKKFFVFILIVMFLIFPKPGKAQDYKATSDALDAQIQIMELQATIDALTAAENSGSNEISGSSEDIGIIQQDIVVQPTSTSVVPINTNQNTTITRSNFPAYAQPPLPYYPAPEWDKPNSRYSTDIFVGDAGQYQTISEAVKHIPDNAGEVTIYLVSDTEEPQAGISIPIDRDITLLRITSDNGNRRIVWPKDRSVWFFCNGIPLIVESPVTFEKPSMIMGGLVTYSGHSVQASKSTIIINGDTYWVYAGGQSDRDGYASTVNDAFVIVNGSVDRVYAGGRSILGETIVNHATVVVNGAANEIYCSGYTENTNAKATVGRADMKVYGWYNKFGLGLGQGQLFLLTPDGCYQ